LISSSVSPIFQQAIESHQAGHLSQAEASYRQILQIEPYHLDALHLSGLLAHQMGRNELAVELIGNALALQPDFVEAHNNIGLALKELGKLDEAVDHFRKALSFRPDYAEVHSNLGIVLQEQGKLDEAVMHYRKALAFNPDDAEAHNHLVFSLKEMGLLKEAVEHCRKALAIKPDSFGDHNNLGNLLRQQGKLKDAAASYHTAILHKPDFAEAYYNLGVVLGDLARHDEAAACFKELLLIEPDYVFASGMVLFSKKSCCNWVGIEDASRELLGGIDAGKPVSPPFNLLAIPSTLEQQHRCAVMYVRKQYPEDTNPLNITGRVSRDKIRLGYYSSDFHDHPVAKLTAELFELHDRSRFEVIGFSYGASPNDEMYQRLKASFDRFLDVRDQTDQSIAYLARSLEIDIAVDLTGHTGSSRTGIFSMRTAPIQVSYLGYPGTMGASYIDYLIADPTLIPVEHQPYYSEKIAYLPDTYLVNGSHREMSERHFTRSEAGLPEHGFVFCCFNNYYKITPAVFDIWMRLLQQVEGSVLWLPEGNAQGMQNLHHEAELRGIAPERLVFAKRMNLLSEHLARYRLADLFLDTFCYNAHTTASDALWAGLPVLTYLGNTFADRVAASLLNAIGLLELITHSHEEYLALALELATNPEKLASLRQQLARNRITHPLFNTAGFTRHIEDAYTQMWQRYQQSQPPDHIYVQAKP